MKTTETLTYISIAVIAISLFFIGTELTGFATTTDTGVVNVTVSSSAAINFTTNFIDFGAGVVDGGQTGATLNTENNVTQGNWTAISTPLVIENIGNVNVSLALRSDKTADTFLGGQSPTFKYKITDVETGSCQGNQAASYTDFTTSDTTVCNSFDSNDTIDTVDVDIELYIPSDSNTGTLTATITATGTYV